MVDVSTILSDDDSYPAWLAAIGGRKFVIASFICIAATILLSIGKIDPATWERVCLWAAGIFGVANVGQKIGTSGKAVID